MEKQKRKVEVFTAGCVVCNPAVEMARSLRSDECDVIVYDLSKPAENGSSQDKVEAYAIKSLPAIVLDGKLLSLYVDAQIPIHNGAVA